MDVGQHQVPARAQCRGQGICVIARENAGGRAEITTTIIQGGLLEPGFSVQLGEDILFQKLVENCLCRFRQAQLDIQVAEQQLRLWRVDIEKAPFLADQESCQGIELSFAVKAEQDLAVGDFAVGTFVEDHRFGRQLVADDHNPGINRGCGAQCNAGGQKGTPQLSAEPGLCGSQHELLRPFPEFETVLLGRQIINGFQFDDLSAGSLGKSVGGCLLVVLAGRVVTGNGRFDAVLAAGDIAFVKAMDATFGQRRKFLLCIKVIADVLAVERQVDVYQPDRRANIYRHEYG